MSTFDVMCDWKAGDVATPDAMEQVLHYLALWCPEAARTEAFNALEQLICNARGQDYGYDRESCFEAYVDSTR